MRRFSAGASAAAVARDCHDIRWRTFRDPERSVEFPESGPSLTGETPLFKRGHDQPIEEAIGKAPFEEQ